VHHQCGDTGLHKIEGIADGFVPAIYQRNREMVSRVVAVHSDDAIAEMRYLASHHGLLVGPSSGANIVAARRLVREDPSLATVVTICCDEGEKYLSEYSSGGARSRRGHPRLVDQGGLSPSLVRGRDVRPWIPPSRGTSTRS